LLGFTRRCRIIVGETADPDASDAGWFVGVDRATGNQQLTLWYKAIGDGQASKARSPLRCSDETVQRL
jgi:hypothetical protein